MNAGALFASVAVLAAWLPTAGVGAATVNLVEVRNNFFSPSEIHVADGETVTWVARDGGHTVTASDGRFSFPEASGTFASGESASWTFHGNETFAYRCKVHGPGMAGVVVVGEGSPPDPPDEAPHRLVPSPEYPTINHALIGVEPSTVVDVEPGIYRHEVLVATPGVTIRGAGSAPGDVVIDGQGRRAVGIQVRADGIRLENLTVRDHGVAGVDLKGVRRFALERVHAVANGFYGIRAVSSPGGAIRGSIVSGAARAGIAIEDCAVCDVDVDDVLAQDNGMGILVRNAGSVTVRRSEIRGNGAGIVLQSDPAVEPRSQDGAHIWGNAIVDNTATSWSADQAVGAGIWIAGGWRDDVEENVITGHPYGIVVTGLGLPAIGNTIRANTLERSSLADLAWDGLGADVCFEANARPDGAEPSSDPPMAQTIYGCDMPHVVGVPWPLVTARLWGP